VASHCRYLPQLPSQPPPVDCFPFFFFCLTVGIKRHEQGESNAKKTSRENSGRKLTKTKPITLAIFRVVLRGANKPRYWGQKKLPPSKRKKWWKGGVALLPLVAAFVTAGWL